MKAFFDNGGILWLGVVAYLGAGTYYFWAHRKLRNGIKEIRLELPNADEILMQFNERIDRARALAEGQKAKFLADGWNETIAEQMAAAFLFTALNEQNSTHEPHR